MLLKNRALLGKYKEFVHLLNFKFTARQNIYLIFFFLKRM